MKEHIKPSSKSWIYRGRLPRCTTGHVYDHLDGTRLISAVENIAEDGLNYHVSISKAGERISSQEARQVLLGLVSDFPVEQWFEDNHQSSIARNFWCHTDPEKRLPCECVTKERPNVEGDFTWRESPRN